MNAPGILLILDSNLESKKKATFFLLLGIKVGSGVRLLCLLGDVSKHYNIMLFFKKYLLSDLILLIKLKPICAFT